MSTGSVTITAEDNSTEDGDKAVTVSGEVPETGVAIAPDNQTLTITDDEGLPKVTLVLTPVTVEEADDTTTDGENEAQAKVTARLQKAHNAEFTVTVAAAAVLPAEAGDFRLSDNPVLTFAAGATDSTGSVTVTAVDNDVDEQEKQVTVSGTVSVAATAVRPPNARTLTITDDDLPAVTIAAETGSVTEGANAVFELTRAGVITKALTVTVQVTQSGAFLKAPADYTEAVQAVFNAGSETTTLTAATEGDDTDEVNGSITATVTAAASDAAYRVGTESSAEVTVEDDDLPTVELVLSQQTIAEQDDTTTGDKGRVGVGGDGDGAAGGGHAVHGDGIRDPGGRLHVEREPGVDVRGQRHREHRGGDRHGGERRRGRGGQDRDRVGHGVEQRGGECAGGADAHHHRRRPAEGDDCGGDQPGDRGDQRGVRADPGRGDHGGTDGGGGRHPVGNLHQDL